jgi:tetratricopeptide (TPR) repeat protein
MAIFGKLFGSRAQRGTGAPAPASAIETRDQLLAEAGALSAAGRRGAALGLLEAWPTSIPETHELWFTRGSILFDWGRFREARDAYLRAEAAGMRGTTLQFQLGLAHQYSGNATAAEACMRQALSLEPDDRRIRASMARLLFDMGRFDEAAVALNSLIEHYPEDTENRWLLGVCKIRQRDLSGAEALFRSALAAGGNRAVIWKDLGVALELQDRLEEAIEASKMAVRVEGEQGELGDSFINLAIQLESDGQNVDAIELFEKMLPLRPNAYGHFCYAHALLRCGRLAEGWHQHEFRYLSGAGLSLNHNFGRPAWSGQPLQDKTIMLWAEQGLGDTIQFVRYATHLKALGAKVLFRAADGLEAFAEAFPGIDKVVERGFTRVDFDYYLNTISLPYVFGTNLASIPAEIPYVRCDPDRALHWARRLQSGNDLKIGIVWAGNPKHVLDRHRSMPLAAFVPLAGLPGVQLYSLQKGSREEEARSPPAGMDLINLGPELDDIRETTTAISQLDLVLSVDTALAHLAGALGKPVWMMLPKVADWRWLEGRDDTPWYPTMRLFRQRRRGEWGDVVERVRSALQSVVSGEEALATTPPPDTAPAAMACESALLTPPVGHRPGWSAVAETRAGMLMCLPDEPLVGDSLRWCGELLQPQLDLLARMVRPGATVVEIGTGVGVHAIALSAMAGGEGHLLLYESSPLKQQLLRQNLSANRVANVTLMREPTAVSPAETVDDLHLDRLDLIKLGIGVVALDVLAGAPTTLWKNRPKLFCAMPDDATLTLAASRLREFGYRCWRMETPWFNPLNFNRRDEDIFSGRTALALVAIPEELDFDIAQDGCVEIS